MSQTGRPPRSTLEKLDPRRLQEINARYPSLRLAVVGDFCLDRYLEIDPAKQETSIETGLPVHNVVQVRSQPGAAGTILNNLVALGLGQIYPVGFCGADGEGFELRRSLLARRGVNLEHFLETDQRRTFTYCKPLLVQPGQAPQELSRLDSKNWTPTPAAVQEQLVERLHAVCRFVDAVIVMDQVDVPETGTVTRAMLRALKNIVEAETRLLVLADSRRGLKGYPPVTFKMNAAELSALVGASVKLTVDDIEAAAATLARTHGRTVFVTLAECGILAATSTGEVSRVPALPVRGEIDVVGAGDAVTANLTAALAAGATAREAIMIANIAASIVLHQLGTTGTASVAQIAELLPLSPSII